MAKNLDFSKLALPSKPEVVAKPAIPVVPTEDLDKAIERIHPAPTETAQKEPDTPKENKKMPANDSPKKTGVPVETSIHSGDMPATILKKISLDVPLEVYKAMKLNAVAKDITMRDYITGLIRKDLYNKKN